MKLSIKDKDEEKKEVKKIAKEPKEAKPKAEKPAPVKVEKKAEPKEDIKKEDKEIKAEKAPERKTEVKQQPVDALEVTKSKKNAGYSAKDIFVLKGLEPVRMRPGMYIGSTGIDGLHHLIWEVVDNSIDESMAGHADNIEITLLPDNRVKISDNGRGIPVEKHPDTGKSTLETVLTTLHAGGKFGGDAYKVSGGLY